MKTLLRDTHLVLFFTRGVSLKTWAELGSLEREIEIYRKLSANLRKVSFVTYGGCEDRTYSERLENIQVLPATWYWHCGRSLTLLNLLIRHFPQIKDYDILKTNQIPGSEIPVWLKKNIGKKLITRCGYLYSQFVKRETKNERMIRTAYDLEKEAFTSADMGIVTSRRDCDYVIQEYKLNPEKLRVIPNYVNTDIFRPIPGFQKTHDIIYIGRAGTQKNLENLLKAVAYLKSRARNISILMIGGCCKDTGIKQLIARYRLDADLQGNVPNHDLPFFLNKARIFILPSIYEGHPKALLEAMSCGLPCIGTDVVGIKDDITHLKNGYLCSLDHKSIACSIETLLHDEALRKRLGRNATPITGSVARKII